MRSLGYWRKERTSIDVRERNKKMRKMTKQQKIYVRSRIINRVNSTRSRRHMAYILEPGRKSSLKRTKQRLELDKLDADDGH